MLLVNELLEDLYESDAKCYRGYPREDPKDGKTIMTLTWKDFELLAKKYDYTNPMKSTTKGYREALKAEKKMLKIKGFDTKYLEMDARITKGANYNKVCLLCI